MPRELPKSPRQRVLQFSSRLILDTTGSRDGVGADAELSLLFHQDLLHSLPFFFLSSTVAQLIVEATF